MRYRYFVGIPHQEVHYRFIRSVLGGEYIYHRCGEREKDFPREVLEADGDDVVWFFSDIYYHLHPRLKGKQVLSKHGLCFGKWLTAQRAECINRHIDAVFQPGATQDSSYRRFNVLPEKIKPVGYTLLFEIPDMPTRENAVLFSSTCFRHWNHYGNLAGLLKRLDPDIEGYLSIHPQTPEGAKQILLNACAKKKNITLIRSQDELLRAFAHCACNISGGVSSVGSPFWFQKKPVIFVRGRLGWNPFKRTGWDRIKEAVVEPLFSQILDESFKISHWRQFHPAWIRTSRPSPAASKVFYPWNNDKDETKKKIIQYVRGLEP